VGSILKNLPLAVGGQLLRPEEEGSQRKSRCPGQRKELLFFTPEKYFQIKRGKKKRRCLQHKASYLKRVPGSFWRKKGGKTLRVW